MRALWRLGGWGAGAATALLLVAFVSTSDSGNQRLGLAFTPAELPARPVATVAITPSPGELEIKRLSAQVQALAADRERAAARIAHLEHQLNDLTGSIKRLADIPETKAAPPPAPSTPPKTTAAPILKPAVSEEPPARSLVAVSPANVPAATLPMPAPAQAETAKAQDQAKKEAEAAPPDAIEDKIPLPPERVAAVEPAPQAAPAPEPPQGEFGIALAGASSIEVARMQWAAVKANFGSMIATLQPRAISERRGAATHYRLVAGPLPTLTAASRLCARIVAAYAICQPVKFSGEPL